MELCPQYDVATAACSPTVAKVMYDQKQEYPMPSESEIKVMQELTELLETFEEATVLLWSSKQPTISLILPMD